MIRRSFSRWPFIAAVALFAAAVSDVLVEAIANTGVFGRAYYDTNDSTIAPALIAAAVLAVGVIAGHMYAACRRSSASRRNWFAAVARDVAAHAPLRDLRFVLALQFGALFVMESAEALLSSGGLAGGLAWLGGPPVAAAALHVAVGIACTLVAGRLMRASVPHFASLVCSALDFVLCARRPSRCCILLSRRDAASCDHAQAARVGPISGRAPPYSPLPSR